jgi:Tol biopolymer transport system component
MPALGGVERKICSLNSQRSSISFSADGRFLAIVDAGKADERRSIFLVDVETGEKTNLSAPPEASEDNTPRFSPDGKQVAFLRSFGDATRDLFVIYADGADERRLTFDKKDIRSLAWSADGTKIFFVSFRENNQPNLWQISLQSKAAPQLINSGGKNIRNIAAAPDGRSVAYVEETEDANIWKITPAGQQPPQKLIASARIDHSQKISPDGKRIVFASERGGHGEIWLSDADGKNQRQLTNSGGAGSPRFSPDGKSIAYDAQIDDGSDIFVISAEGGAARRLTDTPSRDVLPSWSADGKFVYFTSNRTGDYQLWRVPATGGEPVQITRKGAFESFAAPDGKTILYTSGNSGKGIWQVGIDGGEENPVAELANAGFWRSWVVTESGVYYISRAEKPPYRLKHFDFATRRTEEIWTTEKQPLRYHSGLSASPDAKWLLYSQYDQSTSNIMLTELP